MVILDTAKIKTPRRGNITKYCYHIVCSKKSVEIRSKKDHFMQDNGSMAMLTDFVASAGKYNGSEMGGSQKMVECCEC